MSCYRNTIYCFILMVAILLVCSVSAPRCQTNQEPTRKVHPEVQALLLKALNLKEDGQWQEALRLYMQALDKAIAVKDETGQAVSLLLIGNTYMNNQQPDKALVYFEQALSLQKAIDDQKHEMLTLTIIGGVYHEMGQYQKAIEYYENALLLQKADGDMILRARTLNNLGGVYAITHQLQKSLECYEKAIPLFRQAKDNQDETETLARLGSVYHDSGNVQKALECYEKVIQLASASGNKKEMAITLTLIGGIYLEKPQQQTAMEYFQRALPLMHEVGDVEGEVGMLGSIADIYYDVGKPREALVYYEKASLLFNNLKNKPLEADILHNMGLIYDDSGNVQKALECYEKVIQLASASGNKKDMAITLTLIGGIYFEKPQQQTAMDYFQRALSLIREDGDKRAQVIILGSIGNTYSKFGHPRTALKYYERTLSLCKEIHDQRLEAISLGDMGLIYSHFGQVEKALECFETTLPLVHGANNNDLEVWILQSIGSIYQDTGQYLTALEYYERVLPLLNKSRKRNDAGVLSNIGLIYSEFGQYSTALEYFDKALQSFAECRDRRGQAHCLNSLGTIYGDMKQPKKALDYYEKALAIQQEDEDLAGEAQTFHNMGVAYFDLDQPQQALAYFNKALGLQQEGGNNINLARTLYHIGIFHTMSGDLQSAFSYLKKALTSYEGLQGQIDDPTQVGNFQEAIQGDFYAQYAFTLLQVKRPTEAIAMLERGKVQGLARLTTEHEVNLQAILGKENANLWQDAKDKLLIYNQQVREFKEQWRNAFTPEQKTFLFQRLQASRTQAQQAQGNLSLLRSHLCKKYPEFQRLQATEPIPYSQLAHILLTNRNEDTIYLEYAIVNNNTTLLFALSHRYGLKTFILPVGRKELEAQTNAWRDSILTQSPIEAQQARKLYDTLFSGIERAGLLLPNRYVHLVIVADGPLLNIPFSALVNHKGERLIQKYAVSSIYSLSMLTWPTNSRKPTANLLVIANPTNHINPLTKAEQQAHRLVKRWSKSKGLFGSEATKSVCLREMGKYAILHFATHGEVNSLDGMSSSLQFSDGPLEAQNLANQTLTASLAVLSACETAKGQKSGSEGLMGMAWAFRAAGCPSIVASQWKVDEVATANLMDVFYAGLRIGMRKDDALRAAMLAVQNEQYHSAPYFWAAFQVIGKSEPLYVKAR